MQSVKSGRVGAPPGRVALKKLLATAVLRAPRRARDDRRDRREFGVNVLCIYCEVDGWITASKI